MKCKILHESKGRIRLHMAQKQMTLRQADMLLYYLEANENVLQATVYERTADAILYYKEGSRDKVLQALSKFSYADEKVAALVPEKTGRALTREYKEKLVMMVATKFARDLFLPMPIRTVLLVAHAIKYVWKGIKCLLRGKLEVEVLDALSIGISIVRADYSTAGSVMFLLGIGELLEEWTHKKSVDDLARSMALNVDKVWLKTENGDVLVPIGQIKAKDLITVHTGNVIAIDGKVVSGEAMVNQASLTGESVPVAKREGSYAYAGTVVEEGEIVIEAEQEVGHGRYDKVVQMIEDSEKLKSNTESKFARLADKLVPYSLAGTALTYLLTRNVTRALSVLMVDFSCALKLSMPLVVLSAMREAGKYNATVKGGKFLEAIAHADTIVFDKTGTLTFACPTVAKVIPCEKRDANEMLKIAACLEEHFPHSMANAVVKKATDMGISHKEMHSEVEYVVAHGIASKINNQRVVIGSAHFVFDDEHVEISKADEKILDALEPRYSHLYLAIAGKLAAIIAIADPLRPEAKDVLAQLKELGIKKTVMMTGDNAQTAQAIAGEVGVDEFHAEVLPEDKAALVEQRKAAGHTVIMIGDGINDSPALSAADCGIAIGAGAAIAREISDVTIAAESLEELVMLKRLANLMMKRVHNNHHFVIGFNGALILLGTMGILQPTVSALLHNASTLGVSLVSMTNLIEN